LWMCVTVFFFFFFFATRTSVTPTVSYTSHYHAILTTPTNMQENVLFHGTAGSSGTFITNNRENCSVILASWTITLPNLWKKVWVCCYKYNLWYHKISTGAKSKQFICGRCHCSELYLWRYFFCQM
jgi:hypothetical protein